MKEYFSSDFHFGHKNIIKYCNRPFKTLEQMDNTIINNINSRIKPEDHLFFLGDFCFRSGSGRGEGEPNKAKYYQDRINCKNITYVAGNHDRNNSLKTCIEDITIKMSHYRIKLIHNPGQLNTKIIDCDLVFAGHVHQNWKFKRIKTQFNLIDVCNVGVDVWNFYPVTFNEIIRKYEFWKKHGNKEE